MSKKTLKNGSSSPDDQPAPRMPITPREIERELHDSYLTYAMSTIMDRALPDVRDGLKPSQRRILVAMNDLHLNPGRKHRKCAKIAGDTSGNYHPHGESVIYPTLVNMGQDWKMRSILIDKQGNFGSIDGDPPAAMRYTEARLTHTAMAMLTDIEYDTVDFQMNYDETLEEPLVLPGKFPNLIVNGSSGIAVGMSCSSPPHNITETCTAIIAVMDDPEITLPALMEIIPGPDFPTGGIIQGRGGIIEAYSTGRGRVKVRGRVHVETVGRHEAIIIDEIPYSVVQNNLIEKIVNAAKSGKITDIADIKNYSGKTHRTRIMVSLKRGANPEVVEKQLYRYTPLQSTVSIISLALYKGRPQTLTLKQLIECFIEHRHLVIERRTRYLLHEAQKQAHRLEGLILAVCSIEEVISIIRGSRTREEAIESLMEHRYRIDRGHEHEAIVPKTLLDAAQEKDGLSLTRVQAEAIGGLRLIQLVGLEIEKLTGDYASLLEEIEGYELILSDEERIRDIIREDCIELKDRFGSDRLTEIAEGEPDDFDIGSLTPEQQVVVTISHANYVKRMPVDSYREQQRGGRGIRGSGASKDDVIENLFYASTHDDLLCFTNLGRVYRKKVYDIPEMGRTARGRPIVNLIDLLEDERIVAFLSIKDFEEREDYLFFATRNGRVKRTALRDYRNVHRAGIIAISLNSDDTLVDVVLTDGENHVLLATTMGMAIRFKEEDVRVVGRNAAGVKGISLQDTDSVVGLVRIHKGSDLLTITENGYGKRTPMSEYLVQSEGGDSWPQGRGGKGRRDIQTTKRNGPVVSVRCVDDSVGLVFISEQGMVVRTRAGDIRRVGRMTQGVKLVDLKEKDRCIAAACIRDEDINGVDTAPAEDRKEG